MMLSPDQKMMLDKLADYVAGLPEGTSITTTQALGQVFPDFRYDAKKYCGMYLFDIHAVLLEKLEKRNVYPDISAHDGLLQGLPFNLDFVIRHMGTV